MNIEAILGTAGAIFGTGGVGFMFRWMFKNTVDNTNRIGVLEQNSVTSKQLAEAFDKTIVPLVGKIDDTMAEVREMKIDHIIESKARTMAIQMIKDQS